MRCSKEQALTRIAIVNDVINSKLKEQPDLSDIDDSVWTEDECNIILEANLALFQVLDSRNETIAFIAKQARERAIDLLRQVNIPSPELRIDQYPHELSGGMQQRVVIAIALACRPKILIADEPTTALDVTVQAQILALIKELKERLQLSVILITHNMGVVAAICDRMFVMYGGVVVEEGTCMEIFSNPKHPYTRGLLNAIPSIDEDKETLYTIPGQVDTLKAPVRFCRFYKRCSYASSQCQEQEPPLIGTDSHFCRCFLFSSKNLIAENQTKKKAVVL